MSAYQALYRKYRPQTFDDVSGQLAVTQTLKTQIVSGKLSHAYLFTGSRGTGKTSCAKILAKAVNCLHPEGGNPCNRCEACRAIDSGSCMDVLEIDAASNNGVDNVRDLRDDAVYTPSQVRKRVYIVDEVHMLSLSAFNALLKIIEEPPGSYWRWSLRVSGSAVEPDSLRGLIVCLVYFWRIGSSTSAPVLDL